MAECTLLLLAASTKELKTSRNPGARWVCTFCRSLRHAAREEVLKERSIKKFWDKSNTDYALSRSNLGYNFVRNPAHYNLGVRNTFPAGSPAGYLGREVQSKDSEGPLSAAGRAQPQCGQRLNAASVNASDCSLFSQPLKRHEPSTCTSRLTTVELLEIEVFNYYMYRVCPLRATLERKAMNLAIE